MKNAFKFCWKKIFIVLVWQIETRLGAMVLLGAIARFPSAKFAACRRRLLRNGWIKLKRYIHELRKTRNNYEMEIVRPLSIYKKIQKGPPFNIKFGDTALHGKCDFLVQVFDILQMAEKCKKCDFLSIEYHKLVFPFEFRFDIVQFPIVDFFLSLKSWLRAAPYKAGKSSMVLFCSSSKSIVVVGKRVQLMRFSEVLQRKIG